MAIDWEVEYNNRGRVPEHPQIFERWARDGAAYRAEAENDGRAEIGLKFGASPRQTIDIFKPNGGAGHDQKRFAAGAVHPWRLLEVA
jgi:arylformamidase